MDIQLKDVHEATRLLGKRGGTSALEKYGRREQADQWGQRGAEFGKIGGRPPKPGDQLCDSERYARRRRVAKMTQIMGEQVAHVCELPSS